MDTEDAFMMGSQMPVQRPEVVWQSSQMVNMKALIDRPGMWS